MAMINLSMVYVHCMIALKLRSTKLRAMGRWMPVQLVHWYSPGPGRLLDWEIRISPKYNPVQKPSIMLISILESDGMLEGHIATWYFATYPCRCIYACQKSAWMDVVVMLKWVEQVSKPHILEVPVHNVPLLPLDSHRYHMMALVVMHINELNVEVQHIPGGCTGLCQPVDFGVASYLRTSLRPMGVMDDRGRGST